MNAIKKGKGVAVKINYGVVLSKYAIDFPFVVKKPITLYSYGGAGRGNLKNNIPLKDVGVIPVIALHDELYNWCGAYLLFSIEISAEINLPNALRFDGYPTSARKVSFVTNRFKYFYI